MTTHKQNTFKTTVVSYLLVAASLWGIIVSASLAWNIANEKNQSYELALHAARANFNKDNAFRFWGTKHGGVYVPPTKQTPPNPYLAHLPHRDVVTTGGKKLTLMNPAYMVRQMMEDYADLYGIKGRIMGLVALNPKNIADPWERSAIHQFMAGETDEIIAQNVIQGVPHLRLIRPFVMKQGCLKCHGHLGFKVGDVRGGIGISLPMTPYIEIGEKGVRDMINTHIVLFLLGLLGILAASYRTYKNLHERKRAGDEIHTLNTDLMEKTRLLEESNKHLEHRVQQRTSELEQANNEVKRFAYIVSHDLRAPLVNIKGFSAELKYSADDLKKVLSHSDALNHDEYGKELQCIINEDIPEAVEFIETSVGKMDGQINAILNLSRLGSRKLSFEPIDMNALVKEQVSLLQHQIDDNHIEVSIEHLPQLVSDRLAMEQIFGNVLGNAVKYFRADSKGSIKISVDSNTTFHITDNGRGIAAQELKDVFDLFKRAGEQDTVGEGMGLAYVKTLVQLLGGRIWCTSELGRGSTFSFSVAEKK